MTAMINPHNRKASSLDDTKYKCCQAIYHEADSGDTIAGLKLRRRRFTERLNIERESDEFDLMTKEGKRIKIVGDKAYVEDSKDRRT